MRAIFLSILFLIQCSLYSQDCASKIDENYNVNGTSFIKTSPETVLIRGDFSYKFCFYSNSDGLFLEVQSISGENLKMGDELILVDQIGNRENFPFIFEGEFERKNEGKAVIKNTIVLTPDDVRWLTKNNIKIMYIFNTTTSQAKRYTLDTERQNNIRELATCFKTTINPASYASVDKTTEETASGESISSSKSTPVNSSDPELIALKDELAREKERIRNEIKAEQRKLEVARKEINDEILKARETSNSKKTEFANELNEARKKIDAEIKTANKEANAMIQEAKRNALGEIDSINITILEARQNSMEEIQKVKLETSEQILAARKKAQEAIEEENKKLELLKIEYEDELNSAIENSASEIQLVRQEANKAIEDARKKAEQEKDKTQSEVEQVSLSSSEQILKINEETANEIATIKEKSILEKEKLAFDLAEYKRKIKEEQVNLKETQTTELADMEEAFAREKQQVRG